MTPEDRPPLRFESAAAALPDLPDLRLLREALVDASGVEGDQAWSGGARLLALGKRVVELGDLESRIPALAERVRERTERVMSSTVAALRALEARDEVSACRHLVAAGEVEESHHRLGEAESFYARAAELGRRPRDRRGEALALRRLARVARSRGELDRALELYRSSQEIAEASRDSRGSVIGHLGMGHVLADQGRWAQARDSYLRGMEDVEGASTSELVHLCNALSVVERRLGDLASSAEWLDRGETAAAELEDPSALAYLRHGRGKLYLAANDPSSAEAVFREALSLPLESAGRAVTLLNLAEALRAGDRPREAESAAREAERVAIASGDLVHLPHVYLELGEIAGHRGDAEGFVFFEQALDMLGERRGTPLETAAVQQAYGLFEARFGRSELAVARLREAEGLYQTMGSEMDAMLARREIDRLTDAPPNTNVENDEEA